MKTVFISSSSPEFEHVMHIRNTVFEIEQGAIAEEELDSYDGAAETLYALVYDGDEPVATGRIANTPKGLKIGRIAVLKSRRGRGTGALLVNALCDKALSLGAESILVDAQRHAVPFYEKLGFSPTGESEITDRGIIHLPMRKQS